MFCALFLALIALPSFCLALSGDDVPAARGDLSDPPAAAPDYGGAGVELTPMPSGAPHVLVPVLHSAPKISDFLGPKPTAPVVRRMLRISKFIERYPDDGAPSTEPTVAYLGYTHEDLYIAFVCKDGDESAIRAHMLPRDAIDDDDSVEVLLDTFHDSRRAFLFRSNPLGIQADALYTEQTGADFSFDTVWDTWGHRTADGYVVLMRIPFASLRFDSTAKGSPRTWGIILRRQISRKDESDFWPRLSHDVAGRLTQEAVAEGFENIERGKNWQFEPYALAHSFRELNQVDPVNPYFSVKHFQGYTGIDTKAVLRDSLVLDMTFNPDFSQIGINNPAPPNQRFQYFYPELRPFFIENASYFQTPLNLYYTPNIVRPQFGQRLSGKVGDYAIGILNVDDRDPGLEVPPSNPAYESRSHYYVGRVNRDIGDQANLGVIYADQEYLNSFNRNGGVDYRVRVARRWTFAGQGVTSETRNTDNTWQSGQAWFQHFNYSDLHTHFWFSLRDIAAGYLTRTGFFTRPDVRGPTGRFSYTFRPDHGPLLAHSFDLFAERLWDHQATPLDFRFGPDYRFDFKHNTGFSIFFHLGQDRLRPSDYDTLTSNVAYHSHVAGANFHSSPNPSLSLWFGGYAGRVINYSPPDGKSPTPINVASNHLDLDVKPARRLDLNSSYEFDRFTDPSSGAVAYDNHQAIARWNLQMDKTWSLNFIGEYQATLPNVAYTSVTDNRDVYGNLLLTYLPHPGTAFYFGYTTDYVNLDSKLCTRGSDGLCNTNFPVLPHSGSSLMNDQSTIYMKINHLFRF